MTLVMAVLNVTPDSFSDGGMWLRPEDAVVHAREQVAQGADIIDIGGESTRPGATRPGADEEMARVIPVIRGVAALGVPMSIDTMRADVAAAAVAAGATIVNDVSGGLGDEAMLETVAGLDADYVCMHWRGPLGPGDTRARYHDVVAEVCEELLRRRDACLAAGIPGERIVLDPGLGFSKTGEHNWQVLAHLDRFTALGHRVLIGASRKRFLGTLLGGREPAGRDAATAALSFHCATKGVWAVRTHSVADQRDAIAVAARLMREPMEEE